MTAIIVAILAAVQMAAPQSTVDPGYGQGVSAMFAGAVGDTLIMAGGANFPDTPVWDGGRKRFYCEIFTKDGETQPWTQSGMLPTPTAYGMSVSLPDGILCLGGTGVDGQSRMVFRIRTDGSVDTSWPQLPAAISEGAATMADGRIYVAGGVADGIPSAAVWMLDTKADTPGWTPVAPLPAPAVQPVMAASDGKLYLWYGCNPATAEVSSAGYCYDPDTGMWTPIAGHPGDGTFTGAVSASLPDGRIVCAGGVDRAIFAKALTYDREQMRRYQRQPQASFHFQSHLWIYDPATDIWHSGGTDAFSLARAGAGIAVMPRGIVVIEGELKPGVRAPHIAFIPFTDIR